MAEYKTKILIIGSGPAGYCAGIYAARAGLKPIIVTGQQTGGQLTMTSEIENYPGFAQPISGAELVENMRQQCLATGCLIIDDTVTEVDFAHRPFVLSSEKHNQFCGDSVIIATGASARWLNVKGEEKFRGWGVSACATCDGFFYRGKRVAVVGGGNTAAEEALYLAGLASQVLLIHRRDTLRADKILQERLMKNPRINLIWDSVVEEVSGSENPLSLNTVRVKNVKDDSEAILNVDGLFVAIGHTPNTAIFKGQLKLDEQGYIITAAGSCKTSVGGVFAAGDVVAGNHKQAIIAAGNGCQAMLEAEKYLAEMQ